MPTGVINLPIGSAIPPDGSAGNLPAGIVRVKSSAANPPPYFLQALFDAAQDEWLAWAFRLPPDYVSTPVLKLQFKMFSAVAGNVIFEGRVAAVTPGDAQDVDAKAFAAANVSAGVAVPATAGFMAEASLALTTNNNLAAGDFTVLYVARLGSNASDTAAGDLELLTAALEYVST
jgi:hypothetical protein